MTLKLIAVLLTVGGCFSVGVLLSANEQRAISNTAAFLGLIEYIKMKITYSRMPLFEIISSYSDPRLDSFKSSVLYGDETRITPEKWCDAVSASVLKDCVKSELVAFGSDIGTIDSESQLVKAESCAEYLRQYILASSAETAQKSKMYRAIATLTGFMIVIFLF